MHAGINGGIKCRIDRWEICRIDRRIDRWEVRFIGPVLRRPNELRTSAIRCAKYSSSATVGSKVVAMPCCAARILEVDAESEEVRFVGPEFDQNSNK